MKTLITAVLLAGVATAYAKAGTAAVYDLHSCSVVGGRRICSGIQETFSDLETCKAYVRRTQVRGIDEGCYAREVQVPERVY